MKIEALSQSPVIDIKTLTIEEPGLQSSEFSEPIDTGFRVSEEDMEAMEERLTSYNNLAVSWPIKRMMNANIRIIKGELRSGNDKITNHIVHTLQHETGPDHIDVIRCLVLSPKLDREAFSNAIRGGHDLFVTFGGPYNPFALAQSARLIDENLWHQITYPRLKKDDIPRWIQAHYLYRNKPTTIADTLLAIKIAFPQYLKDFPPPKNFTEKINKAIERNRLKAEWFAFARTAATLQLLRAYKIWSEEDGLHVLYEKPFEAEKSRPLPIARNF